MLRFFTLWFSIFLVNFCNHFHDILKMLFSISVINCYVIIFGTNFYLIICSNFYFKYFCYNFLAISCLFSFFISSFWYHCCYQLCHHSSFFIFPENVTKLDYFPLHITRPRIAGIVFSWPCTSHISMSRIRNFLFSWHSTTYYDAWHSVHWHCALHAPMPETNNFLFFFYTALQICLPRSDDILLTNAAQCSYARGGGRRHNVHWHCALDAPMPGTWQHSVKWHCALCLCQGLVTFSSLTLCTVPVSGTDDILFTDTVYCMFPYILTL